MATTPPTISNYNTTTIAGSAGTPWSVATITTSTVTNPTTGFSANVENVFFQLTPTGSTTYAGGIQADFLVGSNGSLTPIDNVFYQPTGASTAAYYGSEALDPYFQATGFTPSNAGYVSTVYNYSSTGALTSVTAFDSTGKVYSSVGNTT